MRSYERGEFLDLCSDTIEGYTKAMRNTAKRVGLSCDYDNEYLTDSPEYRAVTQSIFVDLFKQGKIIEDLRPNIYDPKEATTIADAEVQRIQRKTKLCDIIWQIEDGGEIAISTTRPEMICACGVVVVHPNDPDIVYVGSLGHAYSPQKERGVFITHDGGSSWKHTLFVDQNTGISDIVMDTDNPRILFAGAWHLELKTWQ